MKTFLTAVVCLLWSITSHAQTPPDTFSAGLPNAFFTRFYIGDGLEKPKVAIRLPESMAGRMIVGINSYYSQDRDGVTPEQWAAKAVFTWTLNTGTMDQPGPTSSELVKILLSADSSLRSGNWGNTSVVWPMPAGATYWLVGHWHDTASFVRLGSNQYCLDAPLAVGYKSGPGEDYWEGYTGGGLMVQVTHSDPSEFIPSAVFDPEQEAAGGKEEGQLSAQISGGVLTVALNRANRSYSPYSLQVVNTLGQTVVNETGTTDFGEVRIPWSASRPSGVYFCRIQVGPTSYSVPVVNLK